MKSIGILDYGMGNISSVANALAHLGYDYAVVNTPEMIQACSHLIIPGVGAYAKAMENIRSLNVIASLKLHVEKQKPLLGICLGMQILSDRGMEGGASEGLGFIGGTVDYFDIKDLPIPHVGWNSLIRKLPHPIFAGVKPHVDFYFVHSYVFNCDNDQDILAAADYGVIFPAIVAKDNIVGIQFHPEKSQDNGLLLIENFCEWDGKC